jgi:hypothetical protein
MSDTPRHEPTWWEPLSEAQLATLARITLLWARIDEQLDMIASFYLMMTLSVWDLFVGEATAPKKAVMLRKVAGEKDDPSSVRIKEVAVAVAAVAGRRNLATHGHWNVDQPGGRVCARSRRKNEAFYVEDLEPLEQELTAIINLGDSAIFLLVQETQDQRMRG